MAQYDIRQDKSYRRGLVLGLTMAEVMILLIFVLLMALAAALSKREKEIAVLSAGVGSRLVEILQKAYPDASSEDDYFKELVAAIEARKAMEASAPGENSSNFVEDAVLGQKVREAASKAGSKDPDEFARAAIEKASLGKKSEYPPFISLSEADGYYFESGKATLRPEFVKKLRTVVIPQLRGLVDTYDVNVVEVIGHTDEVPMSGNSNLDAKLISASENSYPIELLRSTDNAGLAIARAVAVVRVLRADARMKGVTVLPLSGAQLIVPIDHAADGSSAESDQTRRRIEMRLRRSTEQVAQAQVQ